MMHTKRNHLAPYLFLAPSFLLLGVFFFAPFAFSIVLSFFNWTLTGGERSFIGLSNYASVLTNATFWISMKNTVIYSAFYVVGINVLAIMIANALVGLNKRYRQAMSAVFFVPYVCSMVAVTIIFRYMYQPGYGILNYALKLLGQPQVGWLTDSKVVIWSIAIMSTWRDTGFYVIIYIAGLMGISESYYDAARVDGANSVSQFRHITLPMLANTTFFNTVFAVIVALQMFDQAWVLTKGGPGYATRTVVLHIYETAFKFYRMGEASANAIIFFFVIMLLTVVRFHFSKRIEE